jgi:hypothetical protein
LGPVDENVIQPAFSDHARPLKTPVHPLITTPAPVGSEVDPAPFSDHAYPPSAPDPSFVTP